MGKIGFNEDAGQTGLLLKRRQIVRNGLFEIAEVDDDLRAGREKLFKIQRGLAAVQLAGHRQIGDAVIKIRDLVFAHLGADADELFGRERRKDHRGDRAAGSDLRDVGGQLNFASARIGEHDRFGSGLFGGLFRRGFRCSRLFRRRRCGLRGSRFRRAARGKAEQHHQCKKQGKCFFHGCTPLIIFSRENIFV